MGEREGQGVQSREADREEREKESGITSEEIDAMPPGREFDILIAEKVMMLDVEKSWSFSRDYESGSLTPWLEPLLEDYEPQFDGTREEWEQRNKEAKDHYKIREPAIIKRREDGSPFWYDPVPAYSTSISAAWEVMEKLASLDFDVDLALSSEVPGDDPERYYCGVQYGDDNAPWKPEFRYCQVWASTAPLAICRAALKATLKL